MAEEVLFKSHHYQAIWHDNSK